MLVCMSLVAFAPAKAGPDDTITATEARLAQLEQQRAAQRAELARAQGPLARLLAAVERLAMRPPLLALIQPASIDDMIHTQALLSAIQPVIAARTADLRRELADTAALRTEAMRTLREIEAGRTGLAKALNARLASLPAPPLRPTTTGVALAPVYRPPLAGQVVLGTGERSEPGWRSRGVTLLASPGAVVVAPAAGQIGYAGRFGGYGAIVILDHGRGWTTLLTGLGRADVRAGAIVAAGGTVGRMGDDRRRLTVELRHRGRTIDVTGMMGH